MRGLKALFIRSDKSLDETIINTLHKIDKSAEVDFLLPDKLEQYPKSSPLDYSLSIILDPSADSKLDNLLSLPSFVIVQMVKRELCGNQEFGWYGTKFIEKFPLEEVQPDSTMFLRSMRRTLSIREIIMKSGVFIGQYPISRGVLTIDRGETLSLCYLDESSEWKIVTGTEKVLSMFSGEIRIDLSELISRKAGNGQIRRLKGNILLQHRQIPVQMDIFPMKDSAGSHIIFVSDVQRRLESTRYEMFLAHVLETSCDGFVVMDQDSRILFWNRGDEEIFGWKASEMIGKPTDFLCSDDESRREYQKKREQLRHEGFIKNYITRSRRKNGEIVDLEMNITALYDETGQYIGACGTNRDITEIKARMEEINDKNTELEHILNVVSHDLRAPLNSINNYVQFIQESINKECVCENCNEMIQRIYANISNMELLIKDLSSYSKLGVNSARENEEMSVDLNSLVKDLVTNIQWQVGRNNFLVECGQLPTIKIDPSRIYQVFENLITNAYKFRKEDGPARAEIRVDYDEENMTFTIKDFGIGIQKKYIHKIFDLFYRTREKAVEGTGAGLAITRKIIDSCGGKIWVESLWKKGTTFHISLPISRLVDRNISRRREQIPD